MKGIFKVLFLLLSFNALAQKEANIWYFGHNAGLDFSNGSPTVLTDGKMKTDEGCATISDGNGKLLFYTDGIKVWDRNHNVMPNGIGLKGDPSSTQSAVVVPKPDNPSIYYIFTVTELAKPDGVRYSEVDMSLNGGLGDVTSNKNILLVTPACEKISAVKKSNGKDIWVVVHEYGNNDFLSFSISTLGVNTNPVISSVGTKILPVFNSTSMANTVGYLKFSLDGTKLINVNNSINVELFDFDLTTGKVSNPKEVIYNNYGSETFMSNYGVEFSPSGKIAYLTKGIFFDSNEVFQYDLTAADIPATETRIYLGTGYRDNFGALQIAPDGKIYGCHAGTTRLFSINNPDVLGVGCNFNFNAITLNDDQKCIFGLPSFIQSYFISEINVQNNCLGDATSFALSNNQSITAASWDFGDGNRSTDISPLHTYLTAGNYKVSVSITYSGGTSTKTKEIIISELPTATKPKDLLVCDDDKDGLYNFDLEVQRFPILNGQDPDLYQVTFYANTTDYANKIPLTTPNNYLNTVPYQRQTIYAEVTNKANANCKSVTTFDIAVFEMAAPSNATTIPKMSICDNTTVGTDTDGRVQFDLTQNANAILNGQAATQFVLSYYKDAVLTQTIIAPASYQNTNGSETIYVKVVNKDNPSCFSTTSFAIEVLALPVIANVVDLKQCDDNTDGFSVFNLEEAIAKITTNAANEPLCFYQTLTDAQNNTNPITNATTYTNKVVSNEAVYARVVNANGCFRIATINLSVATTQIPLNYSKTFTVCDDALLGTNTDGIASFNFSNVTSEIQNIFPTGQLLTIRYFRNLADALAEKNAIADISNYRNIGYPTTQNIFIRVDSQVNNDCLGLGSHITLNVERVPIVQSLTLNHCDDDQDGKFAFDTSTLQSQLLKGLTNISVAYFDQNNLPLSSPLPNPFVTSSQKVKVVVTNTTTTACSYESSIDFVVDDLPEAFAVPANLTSICDDEEDPKLQDGKFAFDTSTFQKTILGSQTGMLVYYFDGNNNPLPSPLPNPFLTPTQQVRVEVVNPINPSCKATVMIPFVVHPIPAVQLTGEELVCSDLPTFTKVIDAGFLDSGQKNNFSYTWTKDGQPIVNATNYELTVNQKGIYTVTTTNALGCARTRTIIVNASDKAKVTVEVKDLSAENTITVVATGAGDYEYALDQEFGEYQKSATFDNVPSGIHTVYVKDVNGCGVTTQEVAVLGIPKYFTPNQDGYNDTWTIKGVNAFFNSKTSIQVFDRYGKLVKQIDPKGEGWDGNYLGQPLPSDDYWYSIQLEDGRVFKGHFTLKR
jgi:gliding motility-associated-like protein